MIIVRRGTDRRHVQRGKQDIWLSFFPEDRPGPLGDGFGNLAMFNEMRLPPGRSSRRDQCYEAELVTFVYKGALTQEDSTGNSCVIHAGEFQHLTTGRGIRHKETNASRTDWAHVFRIALRPSEVGLDCAQEQKRFTAAQRRNVLCVVAAADGRKGSLRIHQDALIYSSILDPGLHLVHELLPGRSAWLHIMYGSALLNDNILTDGDGVGVTSEPSVSFTVEENTEILLVDLGPTAELMRKRSRPLIGQEERNTKAFEE